MSIYAIISPLLLVVSILGEMTGKGSITKILKRITKKEIADHIPVKRPKARVLVEWIVLLLPLPVAIGAIVSMLIGFYQYVYPPGDGVSVRLTETEPLDKLRHLGFSLDERSFARSITMGRIDVTSLFLDAGFSPLQPLDTMAVGRPLTAPHFALQHTTPNRCKLFNLLRERGVDLSSAEASGFSAPVTLLDLAIAQRDEDAVACLKSSYADLVAYLDALQIKIKIMKKLNSSVQRDNSVLSSLLVDCHNDIKYLVGRPEIFSELVEFGENNRTLGLIGSFCLFRTGKDIKYLLSTVIPEQWDSFRMIDYEGPSASLDADIQASERILKYLQ